MENIINKKKSSLAFWSLILGIISILPVIGILTAILSIIFGFIAIKNKSRVGLATTGIVLAILFAVSINSYTYSMIRKGERMLEEYKNTPEYQQQMQRIKTNSANQ